MKTIVKANIEMVALLAKVIETRKVLAKQEEELKDQVRVIMGTERTLEAGSFMVIITDLQRTGLDSKAVKAYLGPQVEQFMVTTEYQTLTIVPKEGL